MKVGQKFMHGKKWIHFSKSKHAFKLFFSQDKCVAKGNMQWYSFCDNSQEGWSFSEHIKW